MKKINKTEKIILAFVFVGLIIVTWLFFNTQSQRIYADINCPKCNSSQVVMTYKDVNDVEHLLCLDCKLKFTMTDAESIRDSIASEEADFEPDEDELMMDSLYNPELECPY